MVTFYLGTYKGGNMENVIGGFKKVDIKNIIGKRIADAGQIHQNWFIKLSDGQLLELVDGQIKDGDKE